MILYFSGSGNCEYIAKYLKVKLNDEIINLGTIIKENKTLNLKSEKPYILIAPVYISAIPLFIEKLLKTANLSGNDCFYFIMTCAGNCASASLISAKRICKKLNKKLMGLTHLSMPQNYLMYFKIANKEDNDIKFNKALENLPTITNQITNNELLYSYKPSLMHRLTASRPMIIMFEKMLYKTKKFNVNNECISCHLCEKLCPKNVINLVDGKPKWNSKLCLHCTACINRCPQQAINYGKKTINKLRYCAKKYED